MSLRRTLAVGAGIAAVIAASAAGGAVAHGIVTSGDIKNDTIRSVDIHNGAVGTSDLADGRVFSSDLGNGAVRSPDLRDGGVHRPDLADGVKRSLDRRDIANLESDGPYPGATDLGDLTDQGDNSNETVQADGARHTVWVQCAPDKVALGGGFRLAADNTQEAAEAIQVIASEPTQIRDGALVVEPIPGDEAQSMLPNGWLVEVVNNGSTNQIVRPWVVCAEVEQ